MKSLTTWVLLGLVLLYKDNAQIVSKIKRIDDCTCPERNIIYQCTVVAPNSSFTVWRGTALDTCVLSLPHMNGFNNFNMTVRCPNGNDIVARGISIKGHSYTSQLTVPARDELQGRQIYCNVDIDSNEIDLDNVTFNLIQEPPRNIQLVDAKPYILTFEWENTTDFDCPSVSYLISSFNCGNCDNETASTNARCTNVFIPSNCTVSVSKVNCGNISLRSPDSIVMVSLRVPDAPEGIDTIPYYSMSGSLLRVVTRFLSLVPFNISPSVDGSARNYTISYTESDGQLCASDSILPSSCKHEVCVHESLGLVSQCTGTIIASIYATNVLGIGDNSTLFDQTFGIKNNFVNVKLLSNTRGLNCTFLERTITQSCVCAVNISYHENCETLLGEYTASGPTNSLSLRVSFLSDVTQYCFVARGTCGTKTAVVEGTLNIATPGTNIITAVVPVTIVTLVAITVVMVLIVLVTYMKLTQLHEEMTPWIICFSNAHVPGSLANVIKVFKDLRVNIVRVNTPWQKNDYNRKPRQINHIHFDCDSGQERLIEERFGVNIVIEKHNGGGDSECRPKTARLLVEDKPGALWEALEFFRGEKINLRGLNTAFMSKTRTDRVKNYVTCICTASTKDKLIEGIKRANGADVRAEHPSEETQNLQVSIQDGVGNLCRVLKVFSENNVRLAWINQPIPIKFDGTVYTQCHVIEFVCNEEAYEKLLMLLTEKKITKNAVQGSNLTDSHRCLEINIRDVTGSLAEALKAFKDCGINLLGVNTQTKDKDYLVCEKEVHYSRITVLCTIFEGYTQGNILEGLNDTGFILDPVESPCNEDGIMTITFTTIDDPETFTRALTVLAPYCKRIVSATQQPNEQPKKVKYKKNLFVFHYGDNDIKKLESALRATQLVVDVKPFIPEDIKASGTDILQEDAV